MKKRLLFQLTAVGICCAAYAQQPIVYPVPQGIYYARHNDDFTVQVRTAQQDWQDLYEYRVMVDGDNPQPASMVQFDFEGLAEMRVKVNNGTVNDVKIRPSAKGIQPKVEGNIIYFALDKPAKLSMEINGDRLHNLHIFANEPEKEVYKEGDPQVMYFGAGMHKPEDGKKRFHCAVFVHFCNAQLVAAFFSDQKNVPVFQLFIHSTFVLNDCITINAAQKLRSKC